MMLPRLVYSAILASTLSTLAPAGQAWAVDDAYYGYNVAAPQPPQATSAHQAQRDSAGMAAASVLSGPGSGKASLDVPAQVGVDFARALLQQQSPGHITVKQLLAQPGAGTYGYDVSNMAPGKP